MTGVEPATKVQLQFVGYYLLMPSDEPAKFADQITLKRSWQAKSKLDWKRIVATPQKPDL